MNLIFELQQNIHWKFILSIILAIIGFFSVFGYLILRRYDHKIISLRGRKRKKNEIQTIEEVRQESLKHDEQIEVLKKAITITIGGRNLLRRAEEEIKSIDRLMFNPNTSKNIDFQILEELSPNIKQMSDNFEKLISEQEKYLTIEAVKIIHNLKIVFEECSLIIKDIYSCIPEKRTEDFFSIRSNNIELKYKNIVELHAALIRYFQDKYFIDQE
jgi:hypothetical protein